MTNVVDFSGVSSLDTPVERIIQSAVDANLTDIVIVGWRPSGRLFVVSSAADGADVNWLLDNAKAEILEAGRS